MNNIENTNKMKEFYRQMISLTVQQISEYINRNWYFLKLSMPSGNTCPEYKECIKFEVYIFVLFCLDKFGEKAGLSEEIRQFIRHETEHKIQTEFQIILSKESIERRFSHYSMTIDNSIRKSIENTKELSISISTNMVFITLLKRIKSCANFNTYVNITDTEAFYPYHRHDMELSNTLIFIFSTLVSIFFQNLFKDEILNATMLKNPPQGE